MVIELGLTQGNLIFLEKSTFDQSTPSLTYRRTSTDVLAADTVQMEFEPEIKAEPFYDDEISNSFDGSHLTYYGNNDANANSKC